MICPIDAFNSNKPTTEDYTKSAEIVQATLDMVVSGKSANYLAGPISTGIRYYELLAKTGEQSLKALIDNISLDSYLASVRWPNVSESIAQANHLKSINDAPVVNTATLHVSNWDNDWYMFMCFEIIKRKIKTLYFRPGWEFSNGSIKEFIICQQADYPMFELSGNKLTINDGKQRLEEAAEKLKSLSLDTSKHESYLELLS